MLIGTGSTPPYLKRSVMVLSLIYEIATYKACVFILLELGILKLIRNYLNSDCAVF